MRRITVLISVMLLVACLVGCGSGLRVTTIQLGRAVNADKSVAGHTTRFAPSDTVYVSVHTAGVGSGKMSVRWKYGDRILGEPSEQVSFRDVAATEFHLQSAVGFPPGDYTVEVFLDGQSVGIRPFQVLNQR